MPAARPSTKQCDATSSRAAELRMPNTRMRPSGGAEPARKGGTLFPPLAAERHPWEGAIMWTCARCGEQGEDSFDSCWKCSAPKRVASGVPGQHPRPPRLRMNYRYFRGVLASWDTLCTQAAEFATELGPDRLVSISHSEDKNDGVVIVWYWA